MTAGYFGAPDDALAFEPFDRSVSPSPPASSSPHSEDSSSSDSQARIAAAFAASASRPQQRFVLFCSPLSLFRIFFILKYSLTRFGM